MLGRCDFDEAVRQTLRIRSRYGNKEVCRAPLCLRAQATHLAEIDHGKFTVCPNQEIAGMRIRIIKATLKGRFQHEACDSARHQSPTPFRQIGGMRGLAPFQTLLRQHTIPGELFDYRWNLESVVVREGAAEQLYVRGFANVIDLGQQHVLELLQQSARVVFLKHGKARRPFIDEVAQNLEIDPNQLVNAGLTHLEHYLTMVKKTCCVDLSNGCASQRF